MNLLEHYWSGINFENLTILLMEKAAGLLTVIIGFYIVKFLSHVLLKKLISRSIPLTRQDSNRQKTLTDLAYNILDYSLYFLTAYWVLAILGLPVSSLLAGAGITGLAIGLGAQGFLTDLVNGIFILIERQYDVGDSVKLATISGTVVNVGIRTTTIQSSDGSLNFIPNRQITTVSNLSRENRVVTFDLPITPYSDLDAIKKAIKTVNATHLHQYPDVLKPAKILGARTDDYSQVVYRIQLTVKNGKQDLIYYHFYALYHQALATIKKNV